MTAMLERPIRFVRPSRYGVVGTTNSTFDYGLRSTLVTAGAAEWVPAEEPEEKRSKQTFTQKEKRHAS